MKIYGVYDVHGGDSGVTLDIERYYESKEQALAYIAEEGRKIHVDDWIIEIEVI